MYTVSYAYFNSKGEQKTKYLTRKTLKGLVKAFKKDLETKELYSILGVTPNLKHYDFEQDGIKEWS